MEHVMLDLETMGNGPQAAICAIGAVEFDLVTGQIGEKFYCSVDLASAVAQGGVMDAATVLWWLKQGDEARAAITGQGYEITVALLCFVSWLEHRWERKHVKVWGNGAAFDNAILATAYRRQGMPVPWDFWNDRCYRTVKALHPAFNMTRSGTHHHAVDDAESQALHLIAMLHGAASGGGAPFA